MAHKEILNGGSLEFIHPDGKDNVVRILTIVT